MIEPSQVRKSSENFVSRFQRHGAQAHVLACRLQDLGGFQARSSCLRLRRSQLRVDEKKIL